MVLVLHRILPNHLIYHLHILIVEKGCIRIKRTTTIYREEEILLPNYNVYTLDLPRYRITDVNRIYMRSWLWNNQELELHRSLLHPKLLMYFSLQVLLSKFCTAFLWQTFTSKCLPSYKWSFQINTNAVLKKKAVNNLESEISCEWYFEVFPSEMTKKQTWHCYFHCQLRVYYYSIAAAWQMLIVATTWWTLHSTQKYSKCFHQGKDIQTQTKWSAQRRKGGTRIYQDC